ncbi:hypothetical protein CRYUN_Cryun08bG0041600 [Craigia yunnanensis]
MNKSLKIYVYLHRQNDPFAHALLPVDFEPGDNYASESYFKKPLMKSHFITKDPTNADLFFLPFSIARLRHDPRIGTVVIQYFIRDYIFNISRDYFLSGYIFHKDASLPQVWPRQGIPLTLRHLKGEYTLDMFELIMHHNGLAQV